MGWNIEKYQVTLELTSDMLGTAPKSKSIYVDHVATKSRKRLIKAGLTDEEIDAKLADELDHYEEHDEELRGHTTFYQDKKSPYLKAYMIKAFLKEAARRLKEDGNLKQLKSKVDQYVFVTTDKIRLPKPEGGEFDVCVRPLRASTPQGERVAISRSDVIEEGAQLTFELHILNEGIGVKLLKELFQYGKYCGLGCWRNGGNGQFKLVKFEQL